MRTGEYLEASNGPNTSVAGVRGFAFALESAVSLLYLAGGVFIESHLTATEGRRLAPEFNAVAAERRRLGAASKKRWPGADPFPGKWKTVRRS
jgi:hypothetical protein